MIIFIWFCLYFSAKQSAIKTKTYKMMLIPEVKTILIFIKHFEKS